MRRLTMVVLGLLAVALVAGSGVAAAGGSATVMLAPAPKLPPGARRVSNVSATLGVTGAVVLRPRDESGLTSFIGEVTSAGSPLFHQYLAPGQFASRFGPTRAMIDAVRLQLGSDGLHVTSVSSDGLLVSFKGSASSVESAFRTSLANYRLADGSTAQATTSAIRVPSSIAGAVAGVIGLDDLVHPQPLSIIRAPASVLRARHAASGAARFNHPAGSPTACADARADAAQFGGLTDDQIANAYGAFGLYKAGDLGTGQHIGILEFEPFERSDIRTFDTCYFGGTGANQMASRLKVIPVDGGQPAGPGSGEAILDVEDVSAMAPGADIDVYETPGDYFSNSDYGWLDAEAAMVNDDRDQVISTSYGICEQADIQDQPGWLQAESLLFQQAAAQGQSIIASAGDTGSDDCNSFRTVPPASGQNPMSVDDPGSQPYVVSVGGTTITDPSQPPQEHVWNDGADYGGGGGGISMSWAMPTWQLDSRVPGIVLPGSSDYEQANAVERRSGFPTGFCQASLAGASPSTPCRTVPDVTADGDEFTGAITVYSASFVNSQTPDGWITIGGTSSSTPLWAALLADVNASATCRENPATASGVGFVSPLLYAVASEPAAYKASFNDITTGDNDIYGLDNGLVFPATKGYDLASGLGSPRLTGPGGTAGLAYYLCSYAAKRHSLVVASLSPAVLPTSGGTVTITGTGFKGGSQVTGIQVGNWAIPASAFEVNSNTSITARFPSAKDTLSPGATAPQDGAGPAPVVVALQDGRSSVPTPASTLQYVDEDTAGAVPSVTGLSPTGGSEVAPTPVKILGSGFTLATSVTFGGVKATSFTVESPYELIATPPAYSNAMSCAPSVPGESPTTDVCQTQVQVTNPQGTNALGTILPPLEGTIPPVNSMADYQLPPGCGCEEEPAPTEFDYVPTPTVTSVSTSPAQPSSLASEAGGTVVTITGKGLDLLALNWADVGDPSLESSQILSDVFDTGTEMQIVAPGQALTSEPSAESFSVGTLAGQSNQLPLYYAGVPVVTSAINTATGRNGAVDTGGAPLALRGQGFEQAVGPIQFVDAVSPVSLGTQYTYTVHSDSSISTQSVAQNAALVDVEVCSVTGCAPNPPDDYFYIYPPGNPRVTSITPTSGPTGGDTAVAISGQNLGCVTGVFFGDAVAEKFSNQQALLDCGSTTLVNATSPPGRAHSKVPVTVTTLESDFTGSGPSRSTATFTYTP